MPRITALEGRRLGQYEIVDRIGRGGMARVYRAIHPALRRQVAINVLPSYFLHEEGFQARFREEAALAAGLDHPHILAVYDFGEDGHIPVSSCRSFWAERSPSTCKAVCR